MYFRLRAISSLGLRAAGGLLPISRLGLRTAGGLLALCGLGAAAATHCDDEWHKKLERQMAEAFNQRPPPSSSSSSSSSTSSYRYMVQFNGGLNLCTKLALVNGLVYAAWQVQSLQYTMGRWFVTGYGLSARSCAQALLSSYSHASLLHLLANMMGLLSFGPMCMDGWETRRAPRLSQLEFMGMYTVAGVGAGLGSSLFSQRWGTGRSGLGASGSLFAALTYAICCYQDSRVYFFFIIEMPAKHALLGATVLNIGMVAKEVMAARGRTGPPIFDGMAHLIGTALGAVWYAWASERAKRRVGNSGGGGQRRGGGGGEGDRTRRNIQIPLPPGGSLSV